MLNDLICELEIGFLRLREDGLILDLDKGASELLGIVPEEARGRVFLWEFYRGSKGEESACQKLLRCLKGTDRVISCNAHFSSRTGASFNAIVKFKRCFNGKEPTIIAAIIKLPLEREIYFNLLKDVPFAIFRISLDNRFEFIDDRGAREIFGYSAEDLIGKRVHEVHFDEDIAENLFREINRALSEQDCIRVRQVLLKRADGTPIWVTSIIRGIYDTHGNLVGREGIMIKTGFLTILNGELLDSNGILSMLGHDVRTLAGSAISFLELLSETNLDEFQRDLLKRAYVSVHGVKRLLENFIYSYRIRTGRIETVEAPFDLNEVINYICSVITPHLKEGVELKVNVPEIPYLLLGDSPKLEQILLNLLVNAAKNTESGFVELSVKKEREDEKVELLFSIRDTGSGIPENIRNQIFSPFKRFSTAYEGLGLGLYISKTLAKLMKGDLWLGESEKGAVFYLRLPFKKGESKEEVFVLNRDA